MADPLAYDTTPAAEARQIALLRQRSVTERLARAFDLSAFALAASRAAIRRAHPHLDALSQARLLFELQFGPQRTMQLIHAPILEGSMSIPSAILPVVRIYDRLHIPYYIGGSIASSAYSLPRTTYDVDIIAAMEARHVAPFVHDLTADYYVDQGSVLDAIVHRSSFNMTHQPTGINVDVFVPKERPFDRAQLARAQSHLLPGADQPVKLASPEDVILNKLAWYELGRRVSDQQWRDVQGILRVQGTALDLSYLRRWAAELELGELLAAALRGERPGSSAPDLPQQQSLLP